jgi:hypothetical protein
MRCLPRLASDGMLPTKCCSVPMGQIQPQKKRPRKSVGSRMTGSRAGRDRARGRPARWSAPPAGPTQKTAAPARGHAAKRRAITHAGGNGQTGAFTRPPTTVGSAPSMPAQTISTRADCKNSSAPAGGECRPRPHRRSARPYCPSAARSPRLLRPRAGRWCPRKPRRWFPCLGRPAPA